MPQASQTNLPTPDFSQPTTCISGIRPYRTSGYRLEKVVPAGHPGKIVVHNYGHGGAGITLSWGTAAGVRDIVSAHLATTADRKVAVLGSGVMGLTAATMLLDLGVDVTIYAEHLWAKTTSAVAGGQWAVSVVKFANEAELKPVVNAAYLKFKGSIGQGFGVTEVPNYTPVAAKNLDLPIRLLPGIMPPRQNVARLPFEHHTKPGFVYQTLMIEPKIFLPRLDRDLRARNVQFKTCTFTSVADVMALPENIIINCTGFGAGKLWNDPDMEAIKGQLVLLPPDPRLTYLYAQNGYIFPRSDAVVVGGSFVEGDDTPDPDPDCCKEILDFIKGQFGKGPVVPPTECHIHHPTNLPMSAPAEVATV